MRTLLPFDWVRVRSQSYQMATSPPAPSEQPLPSVTILQSPKVLVLVIVAEGHTVEEQPDVLEQLPATTRPRAVNAISRLL